MHPEIVQHGPGACPKCGMALEPMTVTARRWAESRARRHDAALLDCRGCSALPVFLLAMGDMVLGHGLGVAGDAIDVIDDASTGSGSSVDAGGALGRLAVLRARLGLDRQPQPNMFTLIALGIGAA